MSYFLLVSRLLFRPFIRENVHNLTENGRKGLSWDMEGSIGLLQARFYLFPLNWQNSMNSRKVLPSLQVSQELKKSSVSHFSGYSSGVVSLRRFVARIMILLFMKR